MKKSIVGQLSRKLGITIIFAGIAASAASLWFASIEIQEFQDDTLLQVASLTSGNPVNTHMLASDQSSVTNIDPELKLMIVNLDSDQKVSWLPKKLKPGFYTVNSPGGDMRVYVRQTDQGSRIAVVQATEALNEIDFNSALRTVFPLLILLPLLAWLTVRIVRKEFMPVYNLVHTLDTKKTDYPELLQDVDIPNEIVPFVHAINRQMERIKQLLGHQSRFIADAAHELRTPLTALSLQAQNLEHANSLETMRERIVPLRAGIERGRRLTEQLLIFARSQTGIYSLDAIDVSNMALELIAAYQILAKERNIDLGLEEAGVVVLYADKDALYLILKNGLDNALCYTPPGGEITLKLHSESGGVIIEVIDSGSGIPVAEQERVFDPFYRINGTTGNGSGLGLTIARDAAIRLGGTISLHNKDSGTGLIFRYRQQCTS